MNTTGRELVGELKSEMLIADASVAVSAVTVTLKKTTAVKELKKGTVLEADADGKCAILAGTSGSTAAYILAEDISTSTSEDVVAEAYQTGKFVTNSLIVADGYTLAVGDIKALRDAGIFLETAIV